MFLVIGKGAYDQKRSAEFRTQRLDNHNPNSSKACQLHRVSEPSALPGQDPIGGSEMSIDGKSPLVNSVFTSSVSAERNPDTLSDPSPTQQIDPRLSELVGLTEATQAYRLTYWQLRTAIKNNRIRTTRVPGGNLGMLRADVEAYERHKAGPAT